MLKVLVSVYTHTHTHTRTELTWVGSQVSLSSFLVDLSELKPPQAQEIP